MPVRWRLIDTGQRDPFTNMALDEALLRGYLLHDSPPTLRTYGWEPAALSLGYSQDADREFNLPFVRRMTGGGMIRHSDELTYSLVFSKEDLGIPESVVSSYKIISSFLIEFYRRLGLKAAFACDVAPAEKLGTPSVFCFAAKEKYDILIGGRKIGGSAQKRCRGAIFQHGSIPIAPQPHGASLSDLLGRTVPREELSKILAGSFKETFNITPAEGRLSTREEDILEDLRARKYGSREWNIGRIDATAMKEEHGSRTALVAG